MTDPTPARLPVTVYGERYYIDLSNVSFFGRCPIMVDRPATLNAAATLFVGRGLAIADHPIERRGVRRPDRQATAPSLFDAKSHRPQLPRI